MIHLAQACEGVDACVFSGDTLYVADKLATLKTYLDRWQRAVQRQEAEEAGSAAAPAQPLPAGQGNKHTSATKLVSMTMSGNLNDVARYVTEFGLSDFFVQAESSGYNSLMLLRMPIDWPVDRLGPLKAIP